MSVQENLYVIWGTKIPYTGDIDHDALDKYRDDITRVEYPSPLILFDGMNGKYIIAGHCIARDPEEPVKCVLPEDFPAIQVMNEVHGALSDIGINMQALEFGWIVVNHAH